MKIKEVQGLRAVAILLVAGYHYFACWTMPLDGNDLYPHTLFKVFKHSWLGVELFFMVSGFVISMTLLRSTSALDFAHRRFVRLWPALVIAVPLVFIVGNAFGAPMYHRNFADLLPSLTLVEPSVFAHTGLLVDWVTPVLWTMWVEIQFYVLAAILFFLLKKRFLAGLVLVTVVARTITWLPAWMVLRQDQVDFLLPTVAEYLPWFLAGALFHRLWTQPRPALWLLVIAAFGAEAVQLWYRGETVAIWFPVVFFAAFTAIVIRSPLAKPLAAPALVFMGEVSYEFYLVHDTIGVTAITTLIERFGPFAGPHLFGAALGLAFALTVAVAIERWTTPLRRRLLRQREMTAVS